MNSNFTVLFYAALPFVVYIRYLNTQNHHTPHGSEVETAA